MILFVVFLYPLMADTTLSTSIKILTNWQKCLNNSFFLRIIIQQPLNLHKPRNFILKPFPPVFIRRPNGNSDNTANHSVEENRALTFTVFHRYVLKRFQEIKFPTCWMTTIAQPLKESYSYKDGQVIAWITQQIGLQPLQVEWSHCCFY